MKQKPTIIENCLMAVVFLAVAMIIYLAFPKCNFAAESYHWPTTAGSSNATNKSVWTVAEKRYWGECDTNGLGVMLELYKHFEGFHDGEPEFNVCNVSVISTTTNLFDWCWKGNKTNLMKIELLDSTGKPVEKTDEGLKYGKFLTEQQYETFFKYGKRPTHLKGYIFINHTATPPLIGGRYLDSFSIPELFKITEPGEYTLRVQVQMGQMAFPEKRLQQIITPPEVSAKIQIRASYIPPTNSISVTQTNVLSK